MEISESVIRLVFLALPGIVGSRIFRRLSGRPSRGVAVKAWEDFTEILLFTLTSYLLVAAIGALGNALGLIDDGSRAHWAFAPPVTAFTDASTGPFWPNIAIACGFGIGVGFAAAYLHNYRVVNYVGRFLRATHRYGDEDVWEFFCNQKHVQWVVIRDHHRDLAYYGALKAFSESDENREVWLENVDVFKNSSGIKLYQTPDVYVGSPRDQISIETVPNPPTKKDEAHARTS